MAHIRSSLRVVVVVALVAAALPACGPGSESDSASDKLARQEKQIKELERGVGERPGTSTAPASSTSDSAGSSAPARSSPRCAADALRAVSVGSQGAAGTQFAQVRFERRGPGQCLLKGNPGVTLLDGREKYDLNVGRFTTGRTQTVQVDARHPAYFDLAYRTNTNAGRFCRSRVTDLAIIPPGEREVVAARLRPKPLVLCLDSVRVGAVRATSALAGSSDAASGTVNGCGSGGSVFRGQVRITDVTSRNVPCATARGFAADFETLSGAETDFRCSEDASCTWRGWECRNDGRPRGSIDHRCEKGNRVVRWQARST